MGNSLEKIKTKRLLVFEKCNSRCAYCGNKISFDSFHIDHITPKLRKVQFEFLPPEGRGTDHIDNLLPSCQSCNCSKSSLSVEDFRKRINGMVNRLNNHSTNYSIAKRFGQIKETIKPIVFYFEKLHNK